MREPRGALVAYLRRRGLDDPNLATALEQADADRLLGDELLGFATAQISLLPTEAAGGVAALSAAGDVELAAWASRGIELVTTADPGYPENLRQVHDRPAALFLAGRLRPGDRRGVAIVGRREPTSDGVNRATRIATALVETGVTVISGLAIGIDAAAHRAAIAAGGRTIAVIGTGHEHVYPREHAELQRSLAAHHALVSPFWPETPPSAETFRARNRVISGLSRGTVIVEASPRSGTRVLARHALGHGRPVFLLPSLLGQSWAAELAARPGVHVVETAEQILEIIGQLDDPEPPVA